MGKSNQGNGAGRPNDEAIAKRAYELYLQRGSLSGYELDDWLQAEAELTATSASNAGSAADDQSNEPERGQAESAPATQPSGDARRPTTRERNTGRRALRQ